MEAVNEIGWTYLTVTDAAAVSLPDPVFGPMAGALENTACRPKHAVITVEGGDVRYRLDGSEVTNPFGLLAKDGSIIDWTEPLQDFFGFISNMSVIATNGATNVLLNISWRS